MRVLVLALLVTAATAGCVAPEAPPEPLPTLDPDRLFSTAGPEGYPDDWPGRAPGRGPTPTPAASPSPTDPTPSPTQGDDTTTPGSTPTDTASPTPSASPTNGTSPGPTASPTATASPSPTTSPSPTSSPAPNGTSHTVTIGGQIQGASADYDPDPLTIQVGDSVVWHNADDVRHTATDENGSFDTGLIESGESAGHIVFDTPGEYRYYCRVHPDTMRDATLIVEA